MHTPLHLLLTPVDLTRYLGRVSLTRINDTYVTLTLPSWPSAPGAVLICIGSSVASAVAIAAATPAACSNFEFVARIEGASFTGRAADISTLLAITDPHPNDLKVYIAGNGFFPEWTGVLCVLKCGVCSSFSAAAFSSSTTASCSMPPVCSNATSCDLTVLFSSSPVDISQPVATINIKSSDGGFAAESFSVNSCSKDCVALLSPFDTIFLLRFQASGQSGSTWVQVSPGDSSVSEKPAPYPAEEMVPIRRGSTGYGRTLVSSATLEFIVFLFCLT
jgi:hypothetical protein